MLIYSTSLRLEGTDDWSKALTEAALWLSRKTGSNLRVESLMQNDHRKLRDGSQLITAYAYADYPRLYAFRYSHKDREISGRRWVTEFGLSQQTPDSEVECGILLRTDEISTLVETPPQSSVPLIVHEILEKCRLSSRAPRCDIFDLDNEREVEAFGMSVEYTGRSFPYILLSPTTEGIYLVDPDRLRFLVEGLAEVVRIPVGMNTYRIAEIIGDELAAWRGAVNLIFPIPQYSGLRHYPTRRFHPSELHEIRENGLEPEKEILSFLTHRVNVPNSWRQITPEKINEVLRHQELLKLKKQAEETGASASYISLLEEENNSQAQQIRELRSRVDGLNFQVEENELRIIDLDDRLAARSYELEQAQKKLTTHIDQGPGSDLPNYIRYGFIDIAGADLSPEQALQLIEHLFPTRLIVLATAHSSARKSVSFRERKKALELLWKLSTDYWSALVAGKGDTDARLTFGNAYSAKESESAEKNPRARQLRTFKYNGKSYLMFKHLKIGNKESIAETLRIHFEWIPDEKKIVIGHCGPHLDHR